MTILKFMKSYMEENINKEIRDINNQIALLESKSEDTIKSRLVFLKEQLIIAKKLGIEENTLDSQALAFTNLGSNFSSYNFNNTISPYYLRGAIALEQEIFNLENRSPNERLLILDEYVELKNNLLALESENTPITIQDYIDEFSKDDHSNWVIYNMSFAEIKNLNKEKQILLISLIIGLVLSTLFVLISQGIKDRKNILKTN